MNRSNRKEDLVMLELLDAIEQRSDVSQRHLAAKLGVALGLTNSYLKRCARKGFVKIKEVPANRYLYFLTPKGFAEKSRLTARFLSTSLNFYRQSLESCNELFETCVDRGWDQVVLCGSSDLAEIAFTRATRYSIKIVGVFDPNYEGGEFLNLPVWKQWENVNEAHAHMITNLEDPLQTYWDVSKRIGDQERILVPGVLGLEAATKHK